jgi:DNA-directed RNA polymerase subunit M/transcription elongation factor TFIIS
MKFCPKCQRVMVSDMSSGTHIEFRCTVCSAIVKGDEYDAHIRTDFPGAEETTLMYSRFIDVAAHDATNQQVARKCKCKLDYMTLIRIGENESIMYVCKCGHKETNQKNAKNVE